MDNELDPVVGSWYRDTDKGRLFRVVAFDEDRGIVELQHFDGDFEEIDASDWFDMDIEPAEAPEDWTGPTDDDVGYAKTVRRRATKEPADDVESTDEEWEDERSEDERDEWDDDDSDDDFDERDSER